MAGFGYTFVQTISIYLNREPLHILSVLKFNVYNRCSFSRAVTLKIKQIFVLQVKSIARLEGDCRLGISVRTIFCKNYSME